MRSYVVLRDRRAKGGVPARPHVRIVNLDEKTPLSRAFGAIGAHAGLRKVHSVFILCHGFEGVDFLRMQSVDGAGGLGLALGLEGVKHENVSIWTAIRGKVENIVVYACKAAQALPGREGTKSDGRYLMGALAIHTQAAVFAADEDQEYTTYHGKENGAFQVGAWEGNLWRFLPNGRFPTLVRRAPVNFDQLLSGNCS